MRTGELFRMPPVPFGWVTGCAVAAGIICWAFVRYFDKEVETGRPVGGLQPGLTGVAVAWGAVVLLLIAAGLDFVFSKLL